MRDQSTLAMGMHACEAAACSQTLSDSSCLEVLCLLVWHEHTLMRNFARCSFVRQRLTRRGIRFSSEKL